MQLFSAEYIVPNHLGKFYRYKVIHIGNVFFDFSLSFVEKKRKENNVRSY